MVILKLRGQNSCEETIFVPSDRFENLIFSSWFSCGPKAKLLTNITLYQNKEHISLQSVPRAPPLLNMEDKRRKKKQRGNFSSSLIR